MEVSQILELVRAGFTKEEITRMTSPEAQGAPVQAETEKPEEVVTQEEKPAEKAENVPDYEAQIKALTDELAAIKKNVFQYNVRNMAVDQPKQEEASDVLAKLINPNYGG